LRLSQPVVLGQRAGPAGEVAHPRGVDDGHGEAGGGQLAGDAAFVAAGGLDGDQRRRRSQLLDLRQQVRDSFIAVRERDGAALRQDADVQLVLGDVDPDKGLLRLCIMRTVHGVPILANASSRHRRAAAAAARVTVRARTTSGRRIRLSRGIVAR